jgi:cytochrome c5
VQRLANGRNMLYQKAIEGLKMHCIMPPKGGMSTLSNDEATAAVDDTLERVGVR